MMVLSILLVLFHCGSIAGFTTSTQSVPPTLEPNRVFLCNTTNPCLNGGTCHEENLGEEEECSSDPGMGETVCHCPAGFKGVRCEIQVAGMCGGRRCSNNERCVLVDYLNTIYQCVNDDDNSDLTAPHCLPGLQHVNYTVDLRDRDKHLVCLDMYYTSNTSYCHDIDSSLEFEIAEEEVSNLFCLKIDYTDWQTCIAINKTFTKDNFPEKPELDVTILALENDTKARSGSITFRVVFNTAPSVTITSKSYVVNIGTENNPFSIDLEMDFNVWDEQEVQYSLEAEDPRLLLNSNDGSLEVELIDRDVIAARIKITDDGIPKLSTTITVFIEVLNLNCNETRSKFYVDQNGLETIPVGRIECVKSFGFTLTYYGLPIDDLYVQIDSNGFVRAGRGSPGRYFHDVTVELEDKLSVSLPRIEFIVGAIKTCTFALANEPFRREYENIDSTESLALSDNVEVEIQSLTPVNVTVDVLFFRDGSPRSQTEVFFLLLADTQSDLNDIDSSIRTAALSGFLGSLIVDRTSYRCSDKVGLTQITDGIDYDSSAPTNSPLSTMNDTYVELTCEGFLLLPVGEVTVEWKMLSSNAPVVPLSFSRLQTYQYSPAADIYRGRLEASNILYKDSGPFTCRITDEAGNSASTSLDVRVIVPPVLSLLPMGQVFIESSEKLTLTCKVVEPLGTVTTITWFKGDEEVKREAASTSQYEVDGSNLESTSYFCRGENLAGTGERSSKLLVVITAAMRCPHEGLWPGATVGARVEAPCANGTTGVQTRTCGNDGAWMSPNTTQCVSDDITDVIADIQWIADGVQVESLTTVTEKLNEKTQPESLESIEIQIVSESLETLLNISRSNTTSLDSEEAVQFTQSFIDTSSNLLDPRTAETWENVDERPTKVLEYVDSVSEIAADSLRHGQKHYIRSKNIDMEVGKTNPLNYQDIEFPTESRREDDATLNSFLFLSNVTVERNSVTGPTSYNSVYYKNLTDQLPDGLHTSTSGNSSLIVNSHTLAFNYFSTQTITLDPPLSINFTHQNNLIIDTNPVCVYLNTETFTWESDGCNTTETNRFYTVCTCFHLTNFAILMNPTNQVEKNLAIQIITYIGCSISVICLVLTVIIYVTVWRYVKNDQAVLLLNTCVCLGVAMMLFLIGIDKTSNEIACKSVAVLLHFFYLVTFFSMLACGLEILWTVVRVFSNRSKVKPLLIGSWILPLVTVAISMGATSLEGYGTKAACWLSTENGLIYAFIAPVLLVIIINFILIGKLVHTLLNIKAVENQDLTTKIQKGLRGICILVPVLGVSWVIGIFAFNEETVVFQYIFAVLNSLQGLFIFITQVCLNQKIRKGLKRYKQRYSSGRLSNKPTDAQSPRAGDIGLGPLQNRDPESSAYANLLEPTSENSGTAGYERPVQLGEGASDVYDLPEDQVQRRSNLYTGLNQRVSNVYNEIGPVQHEHGSHYANYSNAQGYNEESDPTYKNVKVPARSPIEDRNEPGAAYYNMPGKEDPVRGPRLQPIGATASNDTPEVAPPLPRRKGQDSPTDFVSYGSRTDTRTRPEYPPLPLKPKPRAK